MASRTITNASGETIMMHDDAPMIYKAINGVMKDVGAVTKSDFNSYDKYKFRGIDAVMNALTPALQKWGVTIVPTVMDQVREERLSEKGKTMIYSILTVKYTFYALDGSFIECTVVGEGMDRGDKASNKALSSAFKYATFQTFCIATEELIDSEVESPEVVSTITPNQAEELKNKFAEYGLNVKEILAYYKVKSVDEMTVAMYKHAKGRLNKKEEN